MVNQMKQEERCVWLIQELAKEQSQYHNLEIPGTQEEQRSKRQFTPTEWLPS